MYKVFYNNSIIVVSEKLTKDELSLQTIQVLSKKEVSAFLNTFLAAEKPQDYHLSGYNIDDLFHDLKSCFQFIEAAGGLVQNNLQEYLFIKRFNIWDLPKGKMKKNELPEDAAIREVEEECGISNLLITNNLPSTYHIYQFKNTFVLKKTYWYSMFTEDRGELIPQLEEDITEAVWLDKRKSGMVIQASYRSLKENFLSLIQE